MEYGVVIPAWNAERTIVETIESVLNQTTPPTQIIVVNDGSSDQTEAAANGVSNLVEVITQRHQGPGSASSRGIRLLRTPLVAMVDADDLWLPEKMMRQATIFKTNSQVDLVTCNMRQFRHGERDDENGLIRKGPQRSNIVLRREVFLSVGDIIDPPGGRGELVDWLARFREAAYSEYALDEVLALRRIIPGSLSDGRDTARDIGYLKVAHNALRRKRQQQAKLKGD